MWNNAVWHWLQQILCSHSFVIVCAQSPPSSLRTNRDRWPLPKSSEYSHSEVVKGKTHFWVEGDLKYDCRFCTYRLNCHMTQQKKWTLSSRMYLFCIYTPRPHCWAAMLGRGRSRQWAGTGWESCAAGRASESGAHWTKLANSPARGEEGRGEMR